MEYVSVGKPSAFKEKLWSDKKINYFEMVWNLQGNLEKHVLIAKVTKEILSSNYSVTHGYFRRELDRLKLNKQFPKETSYA